MQRVHASTRGSSACPVCMHMEIQNETGKILVAIAMSNDAKIYAQQRREI